MARHLEVILVAAEFPAMYRLSPSRKPTTQDVDLKSRAQRWTRYELSDVPICRVLDKERSNHRQDFTRENIKGRSLGNRCFCTLLDKFGQLKYTSAMGSRRYLEMREIAKMWGGTPARIVRMVRDDQLRPIIVVNDKPYFDPAAVVRVLGAPLNLAKTDS